MLYPTLSHHMPVKSFFIWVFVHDMVNNLEPTNHTPLIKPLWQLIGWSWTAWICPACTSVSQHMAALLFTELPYREFKTAWCTYGMFLFCMCWQWLILIKYNRFVIKNKIACFSVNKISVWDLISIFICYNPPIKIIINQLLRKFCDLATWFSNWFDRANRNTPRNQTVYDWTYSTCPSINHKIACTMGGAKRCLHF